VPESRPDVESVSPDGKAVTAFHFNGVRPPVAVSCLLYGVPSVNVGKDVVVICSPVTVTVNT
jgi:hypothetical protein